MEGMGRARRRRDKLDRTNLRFDVQTAGFNRTRVEFGAFFTDVSGTSTTIG